MTNPQQTFSVVWKAESISPKRTKQGCPLFTVFNIVMEVLAMTIREEKEIKKNTNCKGISKLSLFADDRILYTENPNDAARKL